MDKVKWGLRVLFIDTQQYLDLYRLNCGKQLLVPLKAVAGRVFITTQIADEVTRNKVQVAHAHMASILKGLKQEFNAISGGLPNHLFNDGVANELQAKLTAIKSGISQMRDATDNAVSDLLRQIGRSEDEVSQVLAAILKRAVEPSQPELDRARLRKERGRAPGKSQDALGDQINWEQFLTGVKDWPAIWIISRDGDYCHKYAETVVLNASLHDDLAKIRPEIVVHCFTELEKGLRDFINTNRVPDPGLPALDEAEQINKEQEALPTFWLDVNSSDAANIAVHMNYRWRQQMNVAAQMAAQNSMLPEGPLPIRHKE